jgi:sialate O-acetylesterase
MFRLLRIPFAQLAALALAALLLGATPLHAAVSVSSLFANNMMFQRGIPIKVFGRANVGEAVTVGLAGNSTSVIADASGKWLATLPALPAGGPHTLTINSLTFTDVLVGDVWFCSGQSNIQIILNSDADSASEIPAANYPNIRILRVDTRFPTTDTSLPTLVRWSKVTPDTAKSFSAVSYYFGRDLHQNLNVPIGLIDITRGGTKVEAWTSGDAFSDHPVGLAMLEYYNGLASSHPEKQAQDAPGALFPVFVEPLLPFGLKGVLWYQGEHNTGRNIIYHYALSNMIANWRSRFQQPNLPFLVVQLPNYGDTATTLKNSNIARLRAVQAAVADATPNVEYTVNIDLGDGDGNIHPQRKQPVGKRAALAARKAVYGQTLAWTGPRLASASYSATEVTLNFDLMGGPGLASVLNPNGFLVSANRANGFSRATATVVGNTVRLTGVSNPVAARYAWEDMPRVQLFNTDALPVAPFRTDSWHPDNLAPATWSSLSTKNPLDNEDADNYPNYVEFFANTDFRAVTTDAVIWPVTSPFANTTAYRYRRRDNLWPSITYKLQTSPVSANTWTDLPVVDYPAVAGPGQATRYQVNTERYEVHIPGTGLKARLAISLSGQTWFSQGATGGTNQAPTASITTPANNATVNLGTAVPVSVTSTDDSAVAHVELYVDNVKFGANATTAPYSWSVTGLAAGAHTLHAIAQDDTGLRTTSATVNLTVNNPSAPPAITGQPTSLTVTVGANAAFSVTATGNNLTYLWRRDEAPITAANATGINSPTLTITGATAANAGIYSVVISDGVNPNVVSDDVTLTVNPAPDTSPTVATTTLPAATVGSAYSTTLAVTAGNAPFTWSAAGLPAFLALDPATGVLSGTPPLSGDFPFTATVTDTDGDNASRALTVTIAPAPPAGLGPWALTTDLTILEAEHADLTANGDSVTWTAATEGDVTYVNTAAVSFVDAWANRTQLAFPVTIPSAGTYSVAIRRRALTNSSDSSYLGLDGTQRESAPGNFTFFSGVATNFTWSSAVSLGSLTAGEHTLLIRRREAGQQIDRIALIRSGGTAPTGTGVGPAAATRPAVGEPPAEPAGFARWSVLHFTPAELADAAVSGPDAAPLEDGLPNKLKFALAVAPWQTVVPLSSGPAPDGRPGFVFRRARANTDHPLAVLASTDLAGWSAGFELTVLEAHADHELVRVTPPAGTTPPRWFVRLRVD